MKVLCSFEIYKYFSKYINMNLNLVRIDFATHKG